MQIALSMTMNMTGKIENSNVEFCTSGIHIKKFKLELSNKFRVEDELDFVLKNLILLVK